MFCRYTMFSSTKCLFLLRTNITKTCNSKFWVFKKIYKPLNSYFKMCICNNTSKEIIWANSFLLESKRYMYVSQRNLVNNDSIKNDFIKNKIQKKLKDGSEDEEVRIENTKEKFKKTQTTVFQDIKETKNKVKEKVDEIIEKENIYTIPNFLCLSRIILSPYLGMLIVQANFNFALGILAVAAVTDMLDGWIARTWESQSTKMGSFLDPVADKVLIATLFMSLTYAGLIPILLTGIILSKDIILVTAGFFIRYKSLPPPKTLSRYFDVTYATAQLEPTLISKINTGVQLSLVGITLGTSVCLDIDPMLIEYLWYITGTTTIAAGISYIISKNTYKVFRKNRRQ